MSQPVFPAPFFHLYEERNTVHKNLIVIQARRYQSYISGPLSFWEQDKLVLNEP